MRKPPPLPKRSKGAHKGDCGRVLVVGGCRGMAGAPCLAARGALRGGAGLVKAAVPACIWDVAAVKLDECLTLGLPDTQSGCFAKGARQALLDAAAWADAVVLGPGVSQHAQAAGLLRETLPRIAVPVVLDADGLNAFAGKGKALARAQAVRRWHPLVLTPHPGEAARLLGSTIEKVQANRKAAALELVKLCGPGTVAVLKGDGTLVTDGTQTYVNKTGNSGMASGGTGDVLSGLVAALIGQGMSAFDAACLGVYLHGLAGDRAAKRLGVWSLTANDLLDELPGAFLQHARGR